MTSRETMIEDDLQAVEEGDRLTILTEFGELHHGRVHFDRSDTGYIHLVHPPTERTKLIHLEDETIRENSQVHTGPKVERCLIWPDC